MVTRTEIAPFGENTIEPIKGLVVPDCAPHISADIIKRFGRVAH